MESSQSIYFIAPTDWAIRPSFTNLNSKFSFSEIIKINEIVEWTTLQKIFVLSKSKQLRPEFRNQVPVPILNSDNNFPTGAFIIQVYISVLLKQRLIVW